MTSGSCVLVGKIYTMDDSCPTAGGVVTREGRVAYVGDADEARRHGGSQAEVIDLTGRVALPGFVESHSHPILLGRYLEEVDCRYCSSLEEIVEALRARASSIPPGRWVVGNGYDHTLLKELRHPTRSELDRATSSNLTFSPAISRRRRSHSTPGAWSISSSLRCSLAPAWWDPSQATSFYRSSERSSIFCMISL